MYIFIFIYIFIYRERLHAHVQDYIDFRELRALGHGGFDPRGCATSQAPWPPDSVMFLCVVILLCLIIVCYIMLKFPDGVRTNVFVSRVSQIPYMLPSLLRRGLTILSKLTMRFDDGKWRHFCDDPVCPDPLWELSTWTRRDSQGRSTN